MAFDFPSSPTVGATYTSGGVTYTWDGQAWKGGPIADSGAFVQKAGDTMAGTLAIAPASGVAQLTLNKPTVGAPAIIYGQVAGSPRWRVALGDGNPESGGNLGSDFLVTRFDDSGATIDNPLRIERKTGLLTANLAAPAVFAHRSGAGPTNLPTATYQKINLGQISSGVNVGGWSLSGNALLVPKTGIYWVQGSCIFQTTTANGLLLAGVGINGATPPVCEGRVYNNAANNVNYTLNGGRLVNLTAGNTLELLGYAGAASQQVLDTNVGTFLTAMLVAAT